MEIIKDHEGTEHQQIIIKDIEGDMGESTRMELIQQPDGDVIVMLYPISGSERAYSIEFCTSGGGGRLPVIAVRLRELIRSLCDDQPPRHWPLEAPECTAENPCCDRRDEYNGFASGPTKFTCPRNCSCHD